MCEHNYSGGWEFGPIIAEPEMKEGRWWFYRRCTRCGEPELFNSRRLNIAPAQRKVDEDDKWLFMTRYGDKSSSLIEVAPRLDLDDFR